MPISTVWILKYVQQCYVKWFWTMSSLGAPAFSIKYLSSAISTFKGASFSSKVTLSSSTIVWFADTLTQKWQLDRLTQQKNK